MLVPVSIQTLIVAPAPSPSILVLCPTEDYETHSTCRVVPIWMGSPEASLLGMAMERGKFARPLSHDLFLDAISNLDAVVERAEIVDVSRQTFFARLVLRAGERMIELDARPSDAIALALRQDAPLLMEQRVLDAASYPFVFNKGIYDEQELSEFREFVKSLTPEDFASE